MRYQPPVSASPKKQRILAGAHDYLIPNRLETFSQFGIELVIGKREGYRIWDLDGHEFLSREVGGWLQESGWGYVSTFGGAEPGCVVGKAVLDLCSRSETLATCRVFPTISIKACRISRVATITW